MLTYKTWVDETKRGVFTPRSTSLKALDTAFEAFDKKQTPVQEIQLIEKLKLWLDGKGSGWKSSTRNSTKVLGKGTVERLVEDLSASPIGRSKLGVHASQRVVAAPTAKIIVLSGHGSWEVKKDDYVKLPAKCSIKFYTMNMRTLSDSLGGDIDRGIIAGLEPDQKAGPFSSVPDMRLFPPTGLVIKAPNLATWQVVKIPGAVPAGNKNLQVQIDGAYPGGASLSVIFKHLQPAIQGASSVTFLWAACRASGLTDTGGKKFGINEMQR